MKYIRVFLLVNVFITVVFSKDSEARIFGVSESKKLGEVESNTDYMSDNHVNIYNQIFPEETAVNFAIECPLVYDGFHDGAFFLLIGCGSTKLHPITTLASWVCDQNIKSGTKSLRDGNGRPCSSGNISMALYKLRKGKKIRVRVKRPQVLNAQSKELFIIEELAITR